MSNETRSVSWQIGKAPQVVTASPDTVSTSAGRTQTVTLSFLGDGIASAQSSNTNIATVSGSGTTFTVSGVAVGRATIIFTVSEGTNYLAGSVAIEAEVIDLREVVYIGTTTLLGVPRANFAGARAGSYALFAGGYSLASPYYHANVDAYDTNLSKSTPSDLSLGRQQLGGATAGDIAVFAGGSGTGSPSSKAIVDAYGADLSKISPSANLSQNREQVGSASNGSYAIFAGGTYGTMSANVDAYNNAATRSNPTAISVARQRPVGARAKTTALFAGGYASGYSNVVDSYNAELTRGTPTTLSVGRHGLAGTTAGDYAVFAGGFNSELSGVVDAFDENLTRQNPQNITPRTGLAAAETGGFAVFSGGSGMSLSGFYNTTEVFDASLSKQTPEGLYVSRTALSGATNGEHAIFAGGMATVSNSSVYYDVVDVYLG